MVVKKQLFLLFMICSIVSLTACNEGSPEQKIHTHLEEAVQLEAEFENQQNEITKLEMEEQEIYSEIIELGMDDYDQIVELSDRAIEIIEQRSNLIELEKESIYESEEEFKKMEGIIDELTDEEIKSKVETMYNVMDDRYRAYEQLNEAYLVSLQLETELYELLKQDELEQEELTEHINRVNEGYQVILEANEQFNEYTVEYNEIKKEFYDLANINVTFDENPENQ